MLVRLGMTALLCVALTACPEDDDPTPTPTADITADATPDAVGGDGTTTPDGTADAPGPDATPDAVGGDGTTTPDVTGDAVGGDGTTTPDVTPDADAVGGDGTTTPDTTTDGGGTDTTVSDGGGTDTTVTDGGGTDTTVTDGSGTDTTVADGGGPDADAASDIPTDVSFPDTPEGNLEAARFFALAGADVGTWPVAGVVVTGIKPPIGSSEAEGFFVQASATGPAIFVQFSSASAPPVGDNVDFTITELGIVNGAVHAIGISDLVTNSSGTDITPWIQDVSGVELTAELDDYDSELITISGTFIGEFDFAGTAWESADIVTAGDTSGSIAVRIPADQADVISANGSITGCDVDVAAYPMGRFIDFPQPTGLSASDLTISCPDPAVTEAIALSPTIVRVVFNRPMDNNTISDALTQFTFDGGLTADSAAVSPADDTHIEVTLAAAMTEGTTYTVTVANSIQDVAGVGVDTNSNTATFDGFVAPPIVVINEIDYDMPETDTEEFVELYNPTSDPIDLAGYELVFINGNGGATYLTVELSGSLPAGGYAVVAGQPFLDTITADLEFDAGKVSDVIQNGAADGIGLFFGALLIDGVSYEGDLIGITEGSGGAGEDNKNAGSLQRCPDGTDTGDNGADFGLFPTTPGAANVCVAP